MKPIISVSNIFKQYEIGRKSSYGSLREEIMQTLAAPFRGGKEKQDSVWALRDISFDVKEGEVLGIVGRNGAGKSTLLKILSRITEPTSGRIEMRGRVASLLEVGTGFHPELTGRENIFLNGALLGMSSAEIKAKFDEIVAFAEIEKFLDTPVKRYSSGMYVRLAFAVAAHLEPEILIIDEVLAVGDSVFQKKCIDKMIEVSRKGRTILFVSHNLAAVKALCTKAVLLSAGELKLNASVQDILDAYVGESQLSGREIDLTGLKRHGYPNELIFEKITFLDFPIVFGRPIRFKVRLKSTGSKNAFPDIDFGIAITDKNNNTLIHCSNRFISRRFDHVSDDEEYFFEIENIINPNVYYLTFFIRSRDEIQDWITNAVKIEIEDGNPYRYTDTKQIQGAILPKFDITSTRTAI
ncbi:MAG: ABC transporter ATP-binding protein [Deltaproteobacteria bacterium]|nr:ABC transporter ATP-binding protein [Deltaproteobacteria bacterium]